ncbi:MAG: DMT family transporter [Bradyrhizobiaceae bacterium]|nr:DMT family transporter [Bradyrhizobiaceae bacterium]
MQSKLGVYVLLALMPLLFASNLVIGRGSAELVEPWTLAFWRWLLATLIVLPFTASTLVRYWRDFRAVRREIFILGILGMVLCGGFVYTSLHATTATNATLIYTASALVIVLLDTLYFGQPLTALRVAGLVVGFLGVAMVALGESFHPYHALGLVLVIAGVVLATNPFAKRKSAG